METERLERFPVHEAKAIVDPPKIRVLRAGAWPVERVGASFSGALGGADEPGVFPGVAFSMTIGESKSAPVAVKDGEGINPLQRRGEDSPGSDVVAARVGFLHKHHRVDRFMDRGGFLIWNHIVPTGEAVDSLHF